MKGNIENIKPLTTEDTEEKHRVRREIRYQVRKVRGGMKGMGRGYQSNLRNCICRNVSMIDLLPLRRGVARIYLTNMQYSNAVPGWLMIL
jgi:hypothetical protein